MVINNVCSVRRICAFVILIGCISSSYCIRAGLITELNRLTPLVIKSNLQTPPLILNVKTGIQHGTGEIIYKLQEKPPSLTMKISKRISRSTWPISQLPFVPYLLSLIPKSPVLSYPSWLPHRTNSLSLIPSPTKWSRTMDESKKKGDMQKRLLSLKLRGIITPAEYITYRNLLNKS